MRGLNLEFEKRLELEKEKILKELVPILIERKKKNEKIKSEQRVNGETREFEYLFG